MLLETVFGVWMLAQANTSNHPHIKEINYLPSAKVLDWRTEDFTADEVSTGKTNVFFIEFYTARMYSGKEARSFEKEEAQKVGELFRQFMEDYTSTARSLCRTSGHLDLVQLLPETEEIKIGLTTETGRRVAVIGKKGDGLCENSEEKFKLPGDELKLLHNDSGIILRYTIESTLWWLSGQGTPVDVERIARVEAEQ